ncbi:hypothetical protein MPDQ_005369 [Monascus purpureus]|uniref:Ubiquitin-like modifier HUB1 n=1 Tax=Monascus purpureus TaxID=5098 RepID=A0A507QYP2_MONPU|nr:hypothetical protein MPDQ_005369 [Monascus purpureus]
MMLRTALIRLRTNLAGDSDSAAAQLGNVSEYSRSTSFTGSSSRVRIITCVCLDSTRATQRRQQTSSGDPAAPTMNETSQRARSRSPTRRRGGFRWKEKRRDDSYRPGDDDRRLERGYRDRSNRARSPRGERYTDRYQDRDQYRDRDGDRNRASSRDRRPRRPDHEKHKNEELREGRKEEKRKKKNAAAAAAPSEAMIVVHVNDRLGTKAAIPCLPSDPISMSSLFFMDLTGQLQLQILTWKTELFKAQVAARIGREPHEIQLKRQGERPFKDQLTLEDYGVSHGVQLDL